MTLFFGAHLEAVATVEVFWAAELKLSVRHPTIYIKAATSVFKASSAVIHVCVLSESVWFDKHR